MSSLFAHLATAACLHVGNTRIEISLLTTIKKKAIPSEPRCSKIHIWNLQSVVKCTHKNLETPSLLGAPPGAIKMLALLTVPNPELPPQLKGLEYCVPMPPDQTFTLMDSVVGQEETRAACVWRDHFLRKVFFFRTNTRGTIMVICRRGQMENAWVLCVCVERERESCSNPPLIFLMIITAATVVAIDVFFFWRATPEKQYSRY